MRRLSASRSDPIVAGMNTHLYREARRFPHTLVGDHRIVVSSGLAQEGLSLRAARWRASHGRDVRPYRGVYVLGPTAVDLLDRVRAALAVSPAHAVVGFHTAATLQGFGVFHDDDVHLVIPAGKAVPQRLGIRAHQSVVRFIPVDVHGIPCTGPARTAIDLARVLPPPDALAVLDAVLSTAQCGTADLAGEVMCHQRLKGCRQATRLVPLADGRSECTQETHLRLIIRDAGLLSFEPQVPVLDRRGDVLFRLDLADRRLRVAAEYDGASHLDRGRMREDRTRHNYLSTRHWRMRYFTDRDIYREPEQVAATLRAALADARADPYLAATVR